MQRIGIGVYAVAVIAVAFAVLDVPAFAYQNGSSPFWNGPAGAPPAHLPLPEPPPPDECTRTYMEQSEDEFPPNYEDGEEREENEESWEFQKDLYWLHGDKLKLWAAYLLIVDGDQSERNTLCQQ